MDRGHWHAARTSAYSDAVSASARLVSATTIVIIVRSVRAGPARPRGRQWREPVPLIELIRSAISEAVHYNRVEHGRVPAVPVVGPAVADLIHLLAELLDNATAFSPPDTPILVRGNLVGRGLVVEIEDQGLGIPAEQREQLNTVLSEPPDFGVHTLSEDTRLGLFVVARG